METFKSTAVAALVTSGFLAITLNDEGTLCLGGDDILSVCWAGFGRLFAAFGVVGVLGVLGVFRMQQLNQSLSPLIG